MEQIHAGGENLAIILAHRHKIGSGGVISGGSISSVGSPPGNYSHYSPRVKSTDRQGSIDNGGAAPVAKGSL